MITAILTNTGGSLELPYIGVPLSEETIEAATDVVTLDNNVYTDFMNQKKAWEFPFESLTEEQYNAIRAFYNDQFVSFQYPTLTIEYYSIVDIPVRMYLNTKEVYNNCGSIQNVKLSFRQSNQLPGGSS